MMEKSELSESDQRTAEQVCLVLGLIFLPLGIYSLITGNAVIYGSNRRGMEYSAEASASGDPLMYWIITGSSLVLGVLLLFLFKKSRNKRNSPTRRWC